MTKSRTELMVDRLRDMQIGSPDIEASAVVSVDGQSPLGLDEGDRVDVRAAEYAARFVRFGDPGYFYRNLNAHFNQPHL